MLLKKNVGMMIVSQQATLNGYYKSVWFSENFITSIIALSNLLLQHLVTYRINKIIGYDAFRSALDHNL